MRLVYLGTPEMAVAPLEGLHTAGHDVVLVVTGEDRRRGRRGSPTPSPVKATALELGLEVSHSVDDVLDAEADLGVVVAFGHIIGPHVLAELDMVNLHFSLLPRWRGAAPVERAILAGDTETGVGVMQVAEGLDTGDVYAEAVVPIGPRATAAELRAELVAVGTALLVDTLAGQLPTPRPQAGTPTYAAKFSSDDFRIDWSDTPEQIDRLIRVGGAWTTFRGERLKILAADLAADLDGDDSGAGGGSTIVPTLVQPAGKPPMSFAAWQNGAHPQPDETFV